MQITITGQIPSRSISLSVAQLVSGELVQPEDAPMQLQPFEALGVNGRRFQEIGKRSLPLVFDCYRATNDMEAIEKQGSACVAKLVQLRMVSPTRAAPYVFSNALVTSVTTLRRTGRLYGIGGNATNFTVLQRWVFEL